MYKFLAEVLERERERSFDDFCRGFVRLFGCCLGEGHLFLYAHDFDQGVYFGSEAAAC